jgi:hypothetical protein
VRPSRSRPRAQDQSRVFGLAVEGSYPIDGPAHLNGTLLLPYMRLDALWRLHTATGSTSMAWPCRVWCGCRRPRPEVRNLNVYPPGGRIAQSQSRPPPGRKRVGLMGRPSSRHWAGIQLPAGRRCAREYEFVWQDCLPPRTIRVGARGRGKSWSQRLPPRHTRARPSLSRTRRVGSA